MAEPKKVMEGTCVESQIPKQHCYYCKNGIKHTAVARDKLAPIT